MTAEELRARVVEIAKSYLGNQDPDLFWNRVCPALCGNPHKVAWCGGFALSCLHEAGITDKPWTPGRGFLLTPPRLLMTNDPRPGDIAYFDQPLQHHAIVCEVTDETIFTVDGNQGKAPVERVELREHPRKGSKVVFFSIGSLVSGVASDDAVTANAPA
jgi:hypothetical protein